jgi:NAD(P) transhydrogenase subunit alpha
VQAGARIARDADTLYAQANVLLKVQKPAPCEVRRLREGAVLVSFLQALTSQDLVQQLAARRVTSFGMEEIPRISRAQKMDALSSQGNIAGYKAILIAAESLAKFFPMLMTAAGTVGSATYNYFGHLEWQRPAAKLNWRACSTSAATTIGSRRSASRRLCRRRLSRAASR